MPPTALRQAVQAANADWTPEEVDAAVRRAASQERYLVLYEKLNLDQAREVARRELFPDPDTTQD